MLSSSFVDTHVAQHEIDRLAHYCTAASELKKSPFFIEEFIQLGLTFQRGPDGIRQLIAADFPDRHVRDAMLIPFRRIWMEDEASNFNKVANTIRHHAPDLRGIVTWAVHEYKKAATAFDWPLVDDPGIPPKDIIDLWLNTKLIHTGQSGRKGRFTRTDFDRAAARIGEVQFEYLFLVSVFQVGLCFINLHQFAQERLKGWMSSGQVPSFAFSEDPDSTAIGGIPVTRSTPGVTPDTDSPAARLSRLRRRTAFSGMNQLFSLFPYDDDFLVEQVGPAENVNDLVARLGTTITIVEAIDQLNDAVRFVSFIDDHATVVTNMRCRRGFIGLFQSGQLVGYEDVHPILNDQLQAMKRMLQADSLDP